MTLKNKKTPVFIALLLTVAMALLLTPPKQTSAADHGDAPLVDQDQGADIADCYFFLDPNDNSRIILIGTVHGFIVPGEARNFGEFDHNVRFRFDLENTGDARPDGTIDVTFSPKTAATSPQTATITLPNGQTFTALSTPATIDPAPPNPVITTNAATGMTFFAGLVDDPFFFDIPGFLRFTDSVDAGAPNPAVFNRGRDTFAGYNILSMAFSIPASLIRGNSNVVGVDFKTQRRLPQLRTKDGDVSGFGQYVTIDRTATPAVNVALIPFLRKNEYNATTTIEDANGKFTPTINNRLKQFGTDDTSIAILDTVAIMRGDFLHLDLTVPNRGPGGGNNPEAGFPNGRRLGDDVIDTILFLMNNRKPLSDNANANDEPLRNSFPFIGVPHQPLDSGVDDSTRN